MFGSILRYSFSFTVSLLGDARTSLRFSSPCYAGSIRYSVLHFVSELCEILKAALLARARGCCECSVDCGVCVRARACACLDMHMPFALS